MLALVLETFKDLLIIEESSDCPVLRVSEETVRVPGVRDPGVKQKPIRVLLLPV